MKKKYDQQIEDWKGKYLRALADYQNLEKRMQTEKNEIRMFAAEVVISRLLPIVDTLFKAADHVKDPGFTLAMKELSAAFSELGVHKMTVVGKEFNPHEMECVEVVTGKDNIVTEEVLPGYRLHDKIIRIAQVKVGKGGTYV